MILVTGVSPTFAETNSILPTGGVRAPTDTNSTKMTPKWTGLMPNCAAKGAKIGARIGTEAVSTMKQPMSNKNSTVNRKKVNRLLEMLMI